jgi:HME family heavy-metal exporter
VAQVIPIGGGVKQWRVMPDPARMRALGVGLDAVEAAVAGFAANSAGGFIDRQGQEWLIRGIGRSRRIEDLASLPVGAPRACRCACRRWPRWALRRRWRGAGRASTASRR